MKKVLLILLAMSILLILGYGLSSSSDDSEESDVLVSEQTEECLECHQVYTPGIVEDWRTSEHSRMVPAEALKKPDLEKKVSNPEIPEELLEVAVGCYECHSRNLEKHRDNFEHFGYQINVVVSPKDCSTCHVEEVKQYSSSKKANAHYNLAKNPVYHTLVETITSLKEVNDGQIIQLESSDYTKAETCYGCHGTKVEVKGMRVIETDIDDIEVPVLTNWPNQGVGRLNPDGSSGACTACHPRHSFSIEVARKPETCSQCHLEPDLPAWNVYRESKHGNIYHSTGDEWNWKNIPWTIGQDFKAPTCAVCHNSLLVDPDGEVVAERSHDFGSRLWVRIFGLIYSHPQPKDGRTYLIKNKDGLHLPTTFTGERASEYLLDEAGQKEHRTRMEKVCRSCHGTSWTDNFFLKLQSTIDETDKMVLAATQLLQIAWNQGLADKSNPFDEEIEQKWIKQWLIYANSIRYASAMSGPDYAAFKYGWFDLSKNLQEMKNFIELKGKK